MAVGTPDFVTSDHVLFLKLCRLAYQTVVFNMQLKLDYAAFLVRCTGTC